MNDKINHFFAGLLIASAVGMPAYLENVDLFAGVWSALVSTIIVAATKEWCDHNTDGNKWDWMDFVFTILGALFVVLNMLAFHYGKG